MPRRRSHRRFDGFDGINAHECGGDVLVELAIDWRAEPRRDALRHNLDNRSAGRPGLANAVKIGGPGLNGGGVRRKERVSVYLGPIPMGPIDLFGSDLNKRTANGDASQDLARHSACGNPHRGFARRRASAASIVADAVFLDVGEVGVAGTVLVLDLGIVFRALILVFDLKRNRRACRDLRVRLIGKDPGQNPNLVFFLPLRREARLPRPPFVEVGLNIVLCERDSGGQPSITQPMAGPWLSPQVVTRNR